ncbi:MAG: single-stranded DNA-binding protein [Acholeplasmatales bacterium]|nr:single-stranded DNA-binding protein [Acholeplasmatales bacterium]
MNKVLLTGRITKDPEIRYTQNGMPNLMFTLAVDRQVRDSQGQKQADFVSCVAWSQSADFMSRYIKKGNMLAITGRIQTRSYQGQDNQMHYVTEVVVEAVENLTPRDAQAQPNNFQQPQANPYQGYNNPSYGQQRPAPSYQAPQQQEAPKSFDVEIADEDLPF